jgi:hypothetical protein
MSTPFRFIDLPLELRNRVYHFMSYTDFGVLNFRSTLPDLARVPDLRAEFIPVYVNHQTVEFDLAIQYDRKHVHSYLRAYDRSIVRNATEIHIFVNDDGQDFMRIHDAGLRFALGGRSVDRSSGSAGASRIGNVHVVFDSMRGCPSISREHAEQMAAGSNEWRIVNTKVAERMAAAINDILISHGPNQPPRLTARELRKLVCLLDDIHGIKLKGFGSSKRLLYRHIDAGAAADFWALVERQ